MDQFHTLPALDKVVHREVTNCSHFCTDIIQTNTFNPFRRNFPFCQRKESAAKELKYQI